MSVSDLSPQALFYYGKDELKNKFVVIGEKHGSESSEYPLRELISRKSITKAIPMKDPVSGQIETAAITVNGPISLVETSTSADVNPENLNRCFVILLHTILSPDELEKKIRREKQAHTDSEPGEVRERWKVEPGTGSAQLNVIAFLSLVGSIVCLNLTARLVGGEPSRKIVPASVRSNQQHLPLKSGHGHNTDQIRHGNDHET